MSHDLFVKLRELILEDPSPPSACNLTLVALGDSVTQGLALNPTMLGEDVYHSVLRRQLHARFTKRTFSTINAGVSGDDSQEALSRLERDVLAHHPHLVTVSFGLNDSGWGESGLPRFRKNLTEIVMRTSRSGAAVALLTPNMMVKRDNERVDPNFRHVLTDLIQRQASGLLARYAEEVRVVAAAAGVPLTDVYAEWERRDSLGEDMTAHLANGLNHPDAYGHRIVGELLFRTILAALRQTP